MDIFQDNVVFDKEIYHLVGNPASELEDRIEINDVGLVLLLERHHDQFEIYFVFYQDNDKIKIEQYFNIPLILRIAKIEKVHCLKIEDKEDKKIPNDPGRYKQFSGVYP